MTIPLTKLKIGQKSRVVSLNCSGAVRRHMGDPIEINVRGYELSLRKSEAQEITVETED